MRNFSLFWLAFLVAGALSQTTSAQGGADTGHVSAAGHFSIALAQTPSAQRPIMPAEGTKGGMQYYWQTPDGDFFVSFYDNSAKPEDPKKELDAIANNYLSGVVKNGGKLMERKAISLDTDIGLEIRVSLQTSETLVLRYYLAERRVFILSTRLKETGEKQLKVLDSFKLVAK